VSSNLSTRLAPHITAIAWANRTAFGSPLVPDVKIIKTGVRAVYFPMRHKRFRRCHRLTVGTTADIEHGRATQIEAVKQRHVLDVGEHQLAVDPPVSAARPSPRRVVLMLHFGDPRPLLVVEREVHIGDSIANVTAR
jgi:hypothetical protein